MKQNPEIRNYNTPEIAAGTQFYNTDAPPKPPPPPPKKKGCGNEIM